MRAPRALGHPDAGKGGILLVKHGGATMWRIAKRSCDRQSLLTGRLCLSIRGIVVGGSDARGRAMVIGAER